jgi:hypothetical protein
MSLGGGSVTSPLRVRVWNDVSIVLELPKVCNVYWAKFCRMKTNKMKVSWSPHLIFGLMAITNEPELGTWMEIDHKWIYLPIYLSIYLPLALQPLWTLAAFSVSWSPHLTLGLMAITNEPELSTWMEIDHKWSYLSLCGSAALCWTLAAFSVS